jgi:hypothetical protein
VLAEFGGAAPAADFDADGSVSVADLMTLLADLGPGPFLCGDAVTPLCHSTLALAVMRVQSSRGLHSDLAFIAASLLLE